LATTKNSSGKVNCNTAGHATSLKDSIAADANYTVTVNDKVVTITFNEAVTSFTIAKLAAQVRVNSIDVYYAAATPNTETGDTPNVNTEVKEA